MSMLEPPALSLILRELADHIDSKDSLDTLSLVDRAVAEYERRRARDSFVSEPIFREPGWDILLDLYIMHARGKRVAISSACIASNVPATTALRYIAVLESEALIERASDGSDQRRIYIELTEAGRALVERCV
jgi:DNA-binding MarR family transcriptional regulator